MGASSIGFHIAAFLTVGILQFYAPGTLAAPPPSSRTVALENLATEDPLAMDSAMKTWVRRAVLGKGGKPEARLRRLATSMLAPDGLRLEEVGATHGAQQAFHLREGNCVSFAFLFVALAREAGVPAFFVLSQTSEGSRDAGSFRVTDTHMAAAYGAASDLTVFDFGGKSQDGGSFRPIPDATAIAVYYSNRGAELLMEGREGDARELLSRAVETAPDLSLAWVNLGVARRRLGDGEGAELAFRRAIGQEPENLAAWRNLALLLESQTSRRRHDPAALGAL